MACETAAQETAAIPEDTGGSTGGATEFPDRSLGAGVSAAAAAADDNDASALDDVCGVGDLRSSGYSKTLAQGKSEAAKQAMKVYENLSVIFNFLKYAQRAMTCEMKLTSFNCSYPPFFCFQGAAKSERSFFFY